MTEVKAGYNAPNGWRCHVCGEWIPWNAIHTTHPDETVNLSSVIAGADNEEQHDAAQAELARLVKERDEWERLAMRYLKEVQELRAALGRIYQIYKSTIKESDA